MCEQIRFCEDVERCLRSGPSSAFTNLKTYYDQLNIQLQQFSETLVDNRVLRLKLKSLILDLIHHIDIVQQLLKTKKLY